MKLHYRSIGEGKPLFILHGLFGSSDNWQTLGKKFAEYFKVYFVDQRNHGRSFHSDEFSYELMVSDLKNLIEEVGEDGFNSLQLDNDYPGSAYVGFQKYIRSLKDRGLFLAICSKNTKEIC